MNLLFKLFIGFTAYTFCFAVGVIYAGPEEQEVCESEPPPYNHPELTMPAVPDPKEATISPMLEPRSIFPRRAVYED